MKTLIVDDDQSIRESLTIIVNTLNGFNIIGTATNGEEAIKKATDQTDLILMDIRMPNMDGITATSIIKKQHPNIKIVMLTTFHDFKNIHQSLQAGADGYLIKTDDLKKQLALLKNLSIGQAILSQETLNIMLNPPKDNTLTPRENELLKSIANGFSNKEIAQQLYISEGTVRNTISVILDKLDLRDRTQLAIYYWQTS